MRKTQKKYKTWEIIDVVFMVIQIFFSSLLGYLVKKVLPFKYWVIVVAMLVIACVFVIFKIKSLTKKMYASTRRRNRRKYKGRRNWVRTFSVLISVVLSVCIVVVNRGLSTLNEVTGEKYQTQVVSVVVRSDSAYEEINDLQGHTVGFIPQMDAENTQNALEAISTEKEVSLEQIEYVSIAELVAALSDGEVESIMFNEAYRGLIEEENATFSNDTKIVYQYEILEELTIVQPEVEVAEESFNIYISGIDTYGPVSTVSRSDVNMVVTINPNTKQILMTSIPRDYYVQLASFGAKDKLTHAGIYGVEESMKTLGNLFGINIDYYARVNFTSLITMVDALGGITVNNPQEFTSYHTHDYYPAGEIYMNGETALEFVRERYGLSGGDNDRIKNQQRVLAAMIDKAISPAIITNYSKILDAVSGSFTTNMSAENIQDLIQMQLADMSPWTIEQVSVTGTGTTSTSCYSAPGYSLYVMEPDYTSVEAAAAKINEVLNAE